MEDKAESRLGRGSCTIVDVVVWYIYVNKENRESREEVVKVDQERDYI